MEKCKSTKQGQRWLISINLTAFYDLVCRVVSVLGALEVIREIV